MAWITAATLYHHYSESIIIDLTSATTPPVAVDTDVVTAGINAAISEIQAALSNLYPTDCAAQTTSAFISAVCASLTVGYLARQRPGKSSWFENQATWARARLEKLKKREMTISEWAAPLDPAQTGKVEPPAESDVFDYAVDAWDVPDEHADDER